MDLRKYLEEREPRISQEDFAKKLGVTQGLVSQWLVWLDTAGEKGTRVTAERAIQIEEQTAGEVGRHELRPDLYQAPAEARAA